MIGGRPIGGYLLTTPLEHHGKTIRCIEVASPKPGRVHTNGLEHAEFVIGAQSLQQFADAYPAGGTGYNTKAAKKECNPDISIELGKYSAKFHQEPLYVVAARERDSNQFLPVPAGFFDTHT